MVTVLFQTESHFPVSRIKVREAVITALKGKVLRDAEVSISIVGDRKMHALNKQYRGRDYPTDVLSFGLTESTSAGLPFVEPPDNTLRLGDILVSFPQARAQAATEDKLIDDKIVELILHGLNHLLGIHHPE